jgi:hypothetical protein
MTETAMKIFNCECEFGGRDGCVCFGCRLWQRYGRVLLDRGIRLLWAVWWGVMAGVGWRGWKEQVDLGSCGSELSMRDDGSALESRLVFERTSSKILIGADWGWDCKLESAVDVSSCLLSEEKWALGVDCLGGGDAVIGRWSASGCPR